MQPDKIYRIIAAIAMIIFIAGGCTGDFEEINTNPSLLTEEKIQPEVLFTSVLKNSIFATFDNTGSRIGEFAQYYASESSGNLFAPTNYSSPFSWYSSYIINTNEVLRLTANDPQKNDQNAMARIWKVWLYHMMTDVYGDIPYFEAALDVRNVINQPKYDSQEDIYKDMLKELKEAATQLGSKADQASFGNADILYKGNVENWKKFANSLRLRLAIRVRFADAALASEHINNVITAPLISENSENAALKTLQPYASENSSNLSWIYNHFVTDITEVYVGFGITDVMIPTDDPRMPVFFTPSTEGNSYRGRPIQLTSGQKEGTTYAANNVATAGPVLLANVYQIIVLNAAEVLLLKAEAAHAGITTEDKNALYRSGIQKSMEQYEVDQAGVDVFLSNPLVALSGTDEEQYEKIATQKYIATFFQGYEGWAEMRRTGYPRVWIGAEKGITGGIIPRRFTYPYEESLKNKENLEVAKTRMGGDLMTTRIWWDKRPGLPYPHPLQGTFPPN